MGLSELPPIETTGANILSYPYGFGLASTAVEATPEVRVVMFRAEMTIHAARERVRETDLIEREAFCARVAQRLREEGDVEQIWLVSDSTGPVFSVVMSGVSLDRELQLRAMFAEMTRGQPAELEIYDTKGTFDFVPEGERLG